jgi:hypothetical protein
VPVPLQKNYYTHGVLLGGVSDGSKTFITEAPQVPDIIYGIPSSNSSASIEKRRDFQFFRQKLQLMQSVKLVLIPKNFSTGVTF